MSRLTALGTLEACSGGNGLLVQGIRNPGSLGVSRYAARLADALAGQEVDYLLADEARGDTPAHFHLANSSRALLVTRTRRRVPFAVTVHDVVPRTRALHPLYRARVHPKLLRDAGAVVVHSAFAADLLVRVTGGRPRRLEVIPHPARRPSETRRDAARRALGWPDDALIAVVPGVLKSEKLVSKALAAVAQTPGWRIGLAGSFRDRSTEARARTEGALVVSDPSDTLYEQSIVGADCVLCLRSGSVGETNGPLLDALGARRAILATDTGSIREIAGDAGLYCDGTENGIADRLRYLSDPDARFELEREAARRAAPLTWEASAADHAALFREVFDV
jgi:glycosyltransferase involved in cell wall biosynthesis